MNIANDSPSMDYVTYFTQQLPKDLATMAALRDELAKRQGALSAVEDANKMREDAKVELEKAKADAAAMVADAKELNAAAKAKTAELKAKQEKLTADEVAFAQMAAEKDKEFSLKQTQIQNTLDNLSKREKELNVLSENLEQGKKELDARIKALQDKIASLAV